ncbi:MAG TPA: glycosyltransferase family 39 protein [Candidatus Aquilonibacter sp.]|nr:glycosyltransferase family 39 protein [Candidatus Aquilonibacter sp.]
MKGVLAGRSKIFLLLVLAGLALRIGFVVAAGGSQITFHSGGSDAPAYVLLARNLLDHAGYTYAHQPTAFRPPGYPLVLAAFMELFGGRYIFAVRLLQLALGIFTIALCAAAAGRLAGRCAAEATFVFGLFLPTLIFPTAQLLTECLSAFLTAVFLRFLVIQCDEWDLRSAWGLGLSAGFGALVRSNAAFCAPLAGWAVLQNPKRRFARLAIVLLAPLVVVTPWLVRNESVFHGRVLFSTQDGTAAVMGVVAPQGRTQPDEVRTFHAAMPWWVGPLETNSSARLRLPQEDDLNRRAKAMVPELWRQEGWHAIPLLLRKTADFWLSTDQLVDTAAFPVRERMIRVGGVVAYWVVLVLGVCGWLALRRTHRSLAYVLLVYAAGLTMLHLPLVMNTRLRIPLMDPLLVMLAGPGWAWLVNARAGREGSGGSTQTA